MGRSHSVVLLLCLALRCTGSHAADRIAGGHDADIKDFPFQLALISPEGELRGGAVIITESWALTSPSNLHGPQENLTVRAGSSVWFEGGTVHQVTEYRAHEQYDSESHDYSIAVIKVSPPFVFGPGVQACRFPAQDQEVSVGKISLVSGWGGQRTGTPGPPSDVLQVAEIPVLDISKCQLEYDEMTDRMLCGGRDLFEPEDLDSCNGDEGGPMIVDGVLVGLVSWHKTPGCGYYGLPSVYTKVSSMTEWFLEASDLCCGASTLGSPTLMLLLVVAAWLTLWGCGQPSSLA